MSQIAIIDSDQNFEQMWEPLLRAQGHGCALHHIIRGPAATRGFEAPHIVIWNYDHLMRLDGANAATVFGDARNGRTPILLVSRHHMRAAERYAAGVDAAFIPIPRQYAAFSWLLRFALDRAAATRDTGRSHVGDTLSAPTFPSPAPIAPRSEPTPAST